MIEAEAGEVNFQLAFPQLSPGPPGPPGGGEVAPTWPSETYFPHHLCFLPPGRAGGEVGRGVSLDGGEEDDQLQLGGGRRLAHKVQKFVNYSDFHHIL